MNLKKNLKQGGDENERIAERETMNFLKRSRNSYFMARGIFTTDICNQVVNISEGTTQVSIPPEALKEIAEDEDFLDREREGEAEKLAIENIWRIQDFVHSVTISITPLTKKI
ncbi:hypothetical protein AUK10_02365 [Candidatus Gracilibacteria bacterium CG2_30_37_12]|nr:MAG: hypothetical protein AUK10_02365 [Candidatus Gracilibacteria bacterium CG2_30_37_12]